MEVMMVMIPAGILMGVGFVAAFLWATRNGQYDDMDTPSKRILFEDESNQIVDKKTNLQKGES